MNARRKVACTVAICLATCTAVCRHSSVSAPAARDVAALIEKGDYVAAESAAVANLDSVRRTSGDRSLAFASVGRPVGAGAAGELEGRPRVRPWPSPTKRFGFARRRSAQPIRTWHLRFKVWARSSANGKRTMRPSRPWSALSAFRPTARPRRRMSVWLARSTNSHCVSPARDDSRKR